VDAVNMEKNSMALPISLHAVIEALESRLR
jgi:hypothetical protein